MRRNGGTGCRRTATAGQIARNASGDRRSQEHQLHVVAVAVVVLVHVPAVDSGKRAGAEETRVGNRRDGWHVADGNHLGVESFDALEHFGEVGLEHGQRNHVAGCSGVVALRLAAQSAAQNFVVAAPSRDDVGPDAFQLLHAAAAAGKRHVAQDEVEQGVANLLCEARVEDLSRRGARHREVVVRQRIGQILRQLCRIGSGQRLARDVAARFDEQRRHSALGAESRSSNERHLHLACGDPLRHQVGEARDLAGLLDAAVLEAGGQAVSQRAHVRERVRVVVAFGQIDRVILACTRREQQRPDEAWSARPKPQSL